MIFVAGCIRIWNSQTAQCVHTYKSRDADAEKPEVKTSAIVKMMHNKATNQVIVVTFDHNITMYSMNDLTLRKQFVGYNDEILDIKFLGEADSHIAVATNSELLRVYEVASWNCQILQGHTNTVMSLDVNKKSNLIVTSSKVRGAQNPDNTLGYCTVVSVSVSHMVGRMFATWPGHTKDHHKNGTNCLPAWHACIRVGVWQCSATV